MLLSAYYMPDTLLSALHLLTQYSQQSYETDIIIIAILQMNN